METNSLQPVDCNMPGSFCLPLSPEFAQVISIRLRDAILTIISVSLLLLPSFPASDLSVGGLFASGGRVLNYWSNLEKEVILELSGSFLSSSGPSAFNLILSSRVTAIRLWSRGFNLNGRACFLLIFTILPVANPVPTGCSHQTWTGIKRRVATGKAEPGCRGRKQALTSHASAGSAGQPGRAPRWGTSTAPVAARPRPRSAVSFTASAPTHELALPSPPAGARRRRHNPLAVHAGPSSLEAARPAPVPALCSPVAPPPAAGGT